MIGRLPETITIEDEEIPILDTDFRRALIVMQACNDPDLSAMEKAYVTVDAIIGAEYLSKYGNKAVEAVNWYLDGGKKYDPDQKKKPRLMDWEQDEQLIFPAVNKVAGKEVRGPDYLHWWTFLGYFNEINDGLFSEILRIRQKRSSGKKLEKYEQEFYRKNKDLIDIKTKYSTAEQAAIDELNKKLQ